MKKDKIQDILNELYSIDMELKQHEEELKIIIKKLMENKPEIKINQEFVDNLKKELIEIGVKNKKETKNLFGKVFFYRLSFVGIGMAVMALILVPYYFSNNRLNTVNDVSENMISMLNKGQAVIEELGDNAFGDLLDSETNSEAQLLSVNSSESVSAGAGKVGSLDGRVMGMGGMETSSYMPPLTGGVRAINPIYYSYKYVGENFSLESDKTEVFRRKVGSRESANKIDLKSFSLAGINYNKFKNLKINSLHLVDDSDFGYYINLDFNTETLHIYNNWESWPKADCTDQQCWDNWRLKITDVPSDSVAIGIADSFLSDFSINLDNYGEPVVLNDWRTYYENSEDKDNYYIPENILVVYPLIIEGKEVLDERGNPNGLSVDVNIRNNKVSGVRSISKASYQKANYEAVNDSSRIIEVAENGGFRNYWFYKDESAVEKEIKLGTPSLELISFWHHNKDLGKGEELFLEAYVFPVLNKDELEMYYRDYIIVPVAKEIMEEYEVPLIEPILLRSDMEAKNIVDEVTAPIEVLLKSTEE